MTSSTKKLLMTVIRLSKGILKSCELWVLDQPSSVDNEPSTKS
jgi:hypothetical protein